MIMPRVVNPEVGHPRCTQLSVKRVNCNKFIKMVLSPVRRRRRSENPLGTGLSAHVTKIAHWHLARLQLHRQPLHAAKSAGRALLHDCWRSACGSRPSTTNPSGINHKDGHSIRRWGAALGAPYGTLPPPALLNTGKYTRQTVFTAPSVGGERAVAIYRPLAAPRGRWPFCLCPERGCSNRVAPGSAPPPESTTARTRSAIDSEQFDRRNRLFFGSFFINLLCADEGCFWN